MNVVRFIGKITGGGSSTAGSQSDRKLKLNGKSGNRQISSAQVSEVLLLLIIFKYNLSFASIRFTMCSI